MRLHLDRDAQEDWAALTVDITNPNKRAVRVGSAAVQKGETAWLVGFDPDDSARLAAIPLRIVSVRIDTGDTEEQAAISPRLIFAVGPRRSLKGYSGGFVGRYNRRHGEWEYIGQYVASNVGEFVEHPGSETTIRLIVRPPDDVLAWFFGETADPEPPGGSADHQP